jgi:hypothetical protein
MNISSIVKAPIRHYDWGNFIWRLYRSSEYAGAYTISCETYSYILYLCPHPKLSRYSTAIEDSLEAFSRSVLPALQAGERCLDSQEMAGVVDVEARGAIEVSEGDGGRGACDGSAMGEVVRGGGV